MKKHYIAPVSEIMDVQAEAFFATSSVSGLHIFVDEPEEIDNPLDVH